NTPAGLALAGTSLVRIRPPLVLFLFNAPPPTPTSTLSLHDALPISRPGTQPTAEHFNVLAGIADAMERTGVALDAPQPAVAATRSEEHTSELQSLRHLVCRLLLEKKNNTPEPTPDTGAHVPKRSCAG